MPELKERTDKTVEAWKEGKGKGVVSVLSLLGVAPQTVPTNVEPAC